MLALKHNPHDICSISSPYGIRIDPLTGSITQHAGIDIRPKARGQAGDPLYAVAEGIVVVSKANAGGATHGLGYYLDIQHDGFRSRYAHLLKLGLPTRTKVEAGQIIGFMGNTGRSTGVHLHFGMQVGKTWVDPAPYLLKEVEDLTEDQVKKLIEESKRVYVRLADVPAWAKPSIVRLLQRKVISPDSDGSINLTHEMVRLLVMMDRMVS